MCTVLVDGEAVKSCLMLTAQLDGRRVQTVESLAATRPLSPLQERFRDEHALQCGFCTPGLPDDRDRTGRGRPEADRERRSARSWPGCCAGARATSSS